MDHQVWVCHVPSQSQPSLTAASARDWRKDGNHAVCQWGEVRECGVGFPTRTACQASHLTMVRYHTHTHTGGNCKACVHDHELISARWNPRIDTVARTLTAWWRVSYQWSRIQSTSVLLCAYISPILLLTCQSCQNCESPPLKGD